MSACLKALAHAQRASISNVKSYLKRRRKQRGNRQPKSEESESEAKPNEEYDACDEADTADKEKVKYSPEDNDGYSDQDYRELNKKGSEENKEQRKEGSTKEIH